MNIKIINEVLQGINGGTLLQKFLNDINKTKRKFQKSEVIQNLSVGISVFLDGGFTRSHHFGRKDHSVGDTIGSINKGAALIKATDNIYRSVFVTGLGDNPGGALRSNGIVISCSGLKSNTKNEYLAWLILFSIESRMNELGTKFNDRRYRDIENNHLVNLEKKRLAEFNFPKSKED
jgi:hypothetical protein